MDVRKRRCSICGRWFYPNPRTRKTQKTCGCSACREEQRGLTQAGWRRRNPDYWVARRLEAKAEALKQAAGESAPPARLGTAPPTGMGTYPWDLAQDAFGVRGAVFIEFLVRQLLRAAQDAMISQRDKMTTESLRLPPRAPQDATDFSPSIGQDADRPDRSRGGEVDSG